MSIDRFRGSYSFLSNFYMTPVQYRRIEYVSSEHAYQAAKAEHEDDHDWIAESPTPGKAKRRGGAIDLRPGWNQDRVQVMYDILKDKFAPGSRLAGRLDATGDRELIEGNTWGDAFWGVDEIKGGRNVLGYVLMQIRQENRQP